MDAAKRQKREGQYGADVVSAAIQRLEEGLQVEGFIPSATFQGRKPGYVFGRSIAGQGYYPDKLEQKKAAAEQAAQPVRKKVAPLDANQLLEQAERQHKNEADAQVEVLDVKGMKKLILAFEKSIARNLEARMKHAADPDKFVESELDLDDGIRKLHALATAPALYPELVRLGTLTSVLGLLAHDNPDIAATSVGVLHELTDGDVMEGFEEQAAALVDGLLEANALELLVQSLARFDEKQPDEATAVFNALGVIANMVEVRKEVAEQVLSRTKLLQWLLSRLKAREFDSNKLEASELLSVLMQASEANQRRLGAANGVDSLLQAVAMYKGREPKSGDEEELVANLFDALCWVVMLTENKERFVAAEGIELMLLVIKNKKYARLAALKTLDFALTRSTAAAERFVDVLGLKSVFAAFMGKITRTSVRKLEPDEKADEETRAVSVLASLFTGLRQGPRRDRLGAKFVESEFEKVDRLMELFVKYEGQVAAAEASFREQLQGEAPDEEDLEELTTMRDEAGFHTLQLITLLIAHVWSMDHAGMHARVRMLLRQTDHALVQVRAILRDYAENIGDNDGAEEREKRQQRIQQLLDELYEEGEELDDVPPVGGGGGGGGGNDGAAAAAVGQVETRTR